MDAFVVRLKSKPLEVALVRTQQTLAASVWTMSTHVQSVFSCAIRGRVGGAKLACGTTISLQPLNSQSVPATLLDTTICPFNPLSYQWLSTSRVRLITLNTFTSNISLSTCKSISWKRARCDRPAFCTRMSIWAERTLVGGHSDCDRVPVGISQELFRTFDDGSSHQPCRKVAIEYHFRLVRRLTKQSRDNYGYATIDTRCQSLTYAGLLNLFELVNSASRKNQFAAQLRQPIRQTFSDPRTRTRDPNHFAFQSVCTANNHRFSFNNNQSTYKHSSRTSPRTKALDHSRRVRRTRRTGSKQRRHTPT